MHHVDVKLLQHGQKDRREDQGRADAVYEQHHDLQPDLHDEHKDLGLADGAHNQLAELGGDVLDGQYLPKAVALATIIKRLAEVTAELTMTFLRPVHLVVLWMNSFTTRV